MSKSVHLNTSPRRSAKAHDEGAPPMGAGHNPDALPLRGLHVRFNDWELEQLQRASRGSGMSQQSILRALFRAWLHGGTKSVPLIMQLGTE